MFPAFQKQTFQGRNNLKNDTQFFNEKQAGQLKSSIEENFSQRMFNPLARETGFVHRSRKLPASDFVNTLLFSFCSQATTSLPDMAIVSSLQPLRTRENT